MPPDESRFLPRLPHRTMKSLFDPVCATALKSRLATLRADAPARWGKMSASQAVAHMSIGVECTLGDRRPPQVLLGKLVGPLAKRFALGSDAPMPKNAPTAPSFIVTDERELDRERERLLSLIDRLIEGGASACTSHPHVFFGRLTPQEWGVLQFKHLDHHLRQFGV